MAAALAACWRGWSSARRNSHQAFQIPNSASSGFSSIASSEPGARLLVPAPAHEEHPGLEHVLGLEDAQDVHLGGPAAPELLEVAGTPRVVAEHSPGLAHAGEHLGAAPAHLGRRRRRDRVGMVEPGQLEVGELDLRRRGVAPHAERLEVIGALQPRRERVERGGVERCGRLPRRRRGGAGAGRPPWLGRGRRGGLAGGRRGRVGRPVRGRRRARRRPRARAGRAIAAPRRRPAGPARADRRARAQAPQPGDRGGGRARRSPLRAGDGRGRRARTGGDPGLSRRRGRGAAEGAEGEELELAEEERDPQDRPRVARDARARAPPGSGRPPAARRRGPPAA